MPKNGSAMMYPSGWPKNQNRCCQRMAPPLAGSKMCAPNLRSAPSANSAAASGGEAPSAMMAGGHGFPGENGIRPHGGPGGGKGMVGVEKVNPPWGGAQA